jgi:ribonuclease HI
MEFQAAIEALSSLTKKTKAILFSDSRILIDAMKNIERPRAFQPQIEILLKLCQRHKITWQWIKAHSNRPFNDRCDELCTLTRGT